jgi:hypothetical protein
VGSRGGERDHYEDLEKKWKNNIEIDHFETGWYGLE